MTYNVRIMPALDHTTMARLWPFYVYDLGRECGCIRGWECPTSPTFIPDDLTPYFKDLDKKALLIEVNKELGGFILISRLEIMPEIDFYLHDFFIQAKFQNKGVGTDAAMQLFNRFKGKWAVGIIPENKSALKFWKKVIENYTSGHFAEIFKTSEELKTAKHPDPFPMIVLTFDSQLFP